MQINGKGIVSGDSQLKRMLSTERERNQVAMKAIAFMRDVCSPRTPFFLSVGRQVLIICKHKPHNSCTRMSLFGKSQCKTIGLWGRISNLYVVHIYTYQFLTCILILPSGILLYNTLLH